MKNGPAWTSLPRMDAGIAGLWALIAVSSLAVLPPFCRAPFGSPARQAPAARNAPLCAKRLFLRLLKISQVGRRLILSGRHEITIPAQEIIMLADVDVMIVLVAIVLYPSNLGLAPIGFVNCPRLREGVILDRDHVV